jgi:rhodanese-related sulfurtransferase
MDLKQAIFIDTRGEPYFSQGHIPGAIPLTDEEVATRQSELDPNAWIITYCT